MKVEKILEENSLMMDKRKISSEQQERQKAIEALRNALLMVEEEIWILKIQPLWLSSRDNNT